MTDLLSVHEFKDKFVNASVDSNEANSPLENSKPSNAKSASCEPSEPASVDIKPDSENGLSSPGLGNGYSKHPYPVAIGKSKPSVEDAPPLTVASSSSNPQIGNCKMETSAKMDRPVTSTEHPIINWKIEPSANSDLPETAPVPPLQPTVMGKAEPSVKCDLPKPAPVPINLPMSNVNTKPSTETNLPVSAPAPAHHPMTDGKPPIHPSTLAFKRKSKRSAAECTMKALQVPQETWNRLSPCHRARIQLTGQCRVQRGRDDSCCEGLYFG